MTFRGFPDAKGAFFKTLAKHQTREWFQANKERYENEWAAPMLELLSDVRAGIDATYEYCDLDAPKVFRIYRDVRFGKDKTPYKTHIGGTLSITGQGGVMDKPVALYLQLGTEAFAAAGHYRIPPLQLARMRQAIVDPKRGGELTKILAKLEKRGFAVATSEALTRVPRGFDPEHPLAHLLKLKGLIVRFPPMPSLGDAGLVTWLRRECKAAADLVTWTTYAIA